jgi:tetratricopeptide (TPR) repeat protein
MARRKKSPERWAELPETWEEALSDEALREVAGKAVFERGERYFDAGKVSMMRDDGGSATFEVDGSQTYSTELYFEDEVLCVDCTCPHAVEGAFCKHMVAAGLYWRNELEGNQAPEKQATLKKPSASSASQKRQATVASKRASLRAFLLSQSVAALSEKLWEWAQADRDLMAEIKAWHAQSTATDEPDGWKTAISAIVGKTNSFYDYYESSAYAHRAAKVLPLLEKIVDGSPEQGRAACVYALRKIYKVGEQADDSNGLIGDLMQEVQDILLTALEAVPPPGDWIDEWFALMEADPWGLWSEAAVLVAAGPAVQHRYHERAAKDWHAYLKSLDKPVAQTEEESGKGGKAGKAGNPGKAGKATVYAGSLQDVDRWDSVRDTLRRRYLASLKMQGDHAGVLDALSSHPRGAQEHSELVAYCELIGKTREALAYAQAALKLFPTNWRTEDDLLRCYERDGWDEEALAIHRHRLEYRPSVEYFDTVLKAAKAAGRDVQAYRESIYQWAAEREVQTEKPQPPWYHPLSSEQGRQVTTRVQWLLHEKRLDEALTLVQPPHTCDSDLLYEISKKIQKTKPSDALTLMHRVFAFKMPRASTPYTEVLRLVKEIAPLMPQPERGQWLARVRAEYKIKRNFIKGLDALKF